MTLTALLNRWKSDPSVAPNLSAWQVLPKREPEFVSFPNNIDPQLKSFLNAQGITSLYLHQFQAWQSIRAGHHLAQVTGTASGKSLSFMLPVLDSLLKDISRRALFLYPTKALAHDQLDVLKAIPSVSSSAYDGDTPSNQRPIIRKSSQIIVTNPDMLHLGILPYHTNWDMFFSALDFIVLDEMHIYRGVFGSHVANVIRRLKRVAAYYGSKPQLLLTSATIGNPQDHAESLIEEQIQLIDLDYSSRGEKHFLLYNPPVIDNHLGLRVGMQRESVRLASYLIKEDFQTIIFGRSRKSVEFILANLRKKLSVFEDSIRAYRSGYLPSQRREIESSLRSGKIKAVAATTALELGIDIGGLDAAILAGYPGTIAGTWQQAGRSGRSDNPSLSVLVASSNPLDQYLAQNPDYLFKSNPEFALIDPNNLLIVLNHIKCAAYEIPFKKGESFGSFSVTETKELLDFLLESGSIHHSQEKYFFIEDSYPAADFSLRTASNQQIALRLNIPSEAPKVIGIVDKESAYWMVHPGAIYLHGGESFLVENLNLQDNFATLSPILPDYYTEPERKTTFSIDVLLGNERMQGAEKFIGEITVTSQVSGFKKINWKKYEILGREVVNMPSTSLKTTGFWLALSQETEIALRKANLWSSSPNEYGPDWHSIRETILKRDHNTCQVCGTGESTNSLHIHHKQPLRSFPNYAEANQSGNLVTLCSRCHQRAETVVRVNSGIRGLGFVLHSLAPLLLMCDPGDLGVFTEFNSPLGDGRPIVLLHEQIPLGIGYSNNLFDRERELLEKAYQLVSHCSCQDGCPSCVGPGGEKGSGGKKETLAILNQLIS